MHLPDDYDGSDSTPLLFAFHGADGEGSDFIDHFSPPVQNGEFIGVYPNGIANSWNIGLEESKADDVAFAAMLVDALEACSWHRHLQAGWSGVLKRRRADS